MPRMDEITFKKWLRDQEIELQPWQESAATAFLNAMYFHQDRRTGKTFLVRKLDEFISLHGNSYRIE